MNFYNLEGQSNMIVNGKAHRERVYESVKGLVTKTRDRKSTES